MVTGKKEHLLQTGYAEEHLWVHNPFKQWATAAEDHIRYHSCQLRTGNCNLHGLCKIEHQKTRKMLVGWVSFSALYQWFTLLFLGCNDVGIFSWHALGPSVPTEHGLNPKAYCTYSWPCPSLYNHSVPIFWRLWPCTGQHTMSQSLDNPKLVSWTW